MKYAIYDQDTEKFACSVDGGSNSLCMSWTSNIESAQLYGTMTSATNLLGGVRRGNPTVPARPNSILVEVAMTWRPATDTLFQQQKAIYERHLPMYRTAVDDIPVKDWRAFKAAREYLRLAGETVE